MTIEEARSIIWQAMELDGRSPGSFRDSYISNVAMILYDQYNGADFSNREIRHNAGSDIVDWLFGPGDPGGGVVRRSGPPREVFPTIEFVNSDGLTAPVASPPNGRQTNPVSRILDDLITEARGELLELEGEITIRRTRIEAYNRVKALMAESTMGAARVKA